MKTFLNVLRVAGGIIDDNNQLWSNAIVVEDKTEHVLDTNQFASGQKHAKVSISTDKNNELGRQIAKSGSLPGFIEVEVSTTVKKGSMVMEITGFYPKNKPVDATNSK
jgi:hypothetical protein